MTEWSIHCSIRWFIISFVLNGHPFQDLSLFLLSWECTILATGQIGPLLPPPLLLYPYNHSQIQYISNVIKILKSNIGVVLASLMWTALWIACYSCSIWWDGQFHQLCNSGLQQALNHYFFNFLKNFLHKIQDCILLIVNKMLIKGIVLYLRYIWQLTPSALYHWTVMWSVSYLDWILFF